MEDLFAGTVGVVLLNYNSAPHTIECIDSLLVSTYEKIRIVVVDNASCKSDIDLLLDRPHDAQVEIIVNENNLGFSGGNNIGIRKLLSYDVDYILILNNDTVVEPNAIERLVSYYIRSKERIGILSGVILNYYNRQCIWYAGGMARDYFGDYKMKGFNESLSTYTLHDSISETCASGCCMFMPASVAEEFSWNEDYFLYYEDNDYCKQITERGLKIGLVSNAIIYHKESATTHKMSHDYVYYFSRNRLMFIKRNISGLYRLIAHIYTYLWYLKKIVKDGFNAYDVISGIQDANRGVVGPRPSNYVNRTKVSR